MKQQTCLVLKLRNSRRPSKRAAAGDTGPARNCAVQRIRRGSLSAWAACGVDRRQQTALGRHLWKPHPSCWCRLNWFAVAAPAYPGDRPCRPSRRGRPRQKRRGVFLGHWAYCAPLPRYPAEQRRADSNRRQTNPHTKESGESKPR